MIEYSMLLFSRNPTFAAVLLTLTFLIALGGNCFPRPLRAEELQRDADALREKFAANLKLLAADCEKKGLKAEARITLAVLEPHDPLRFFVPVLPGRIGPPALPGNAAPDAVQWNDRLNRLRREQGETLFGLAQRAIRGRHAALAIELLLDCVAADPDNENARRMMRYQKYQNAWRTAYEVQKLRAGQVWDGRFGWLPKSYLKQYVDGRRYLGGKWISAEEDARRRKDIRFGWLVDTEHYRVCTDHSLQAGVALGEKLERLYGLWQQIFLRYYASEADVLAWFEGRLRSLKGPPSRHQVFYFRDRDDYNQFLAASVPGIEKSIGYYSQAAGKAFFFADPNGDNRTLFHEAAHQLFHETRPVAPGVGAQANFWIVEGIAMYMETLRIKDGFYVLGGPDDERMIAARYRLLEDKFYVPLADFCNYGMEKWQNAPDLPKLYSQAAGLTQFFVHYGHGRYRDALVAYLSAVYSGQDTPATLTELTGVPYATLDKQYREFMKQGGGQERKSN
jgi:hypothetical protein